MNNDIKIITKAIDSIVEGCYQLGNTTDWVARDCLEDIEDVVDKLIIRCKDLEEIERIVRETSNAQ